ncbi:MAG: hypothetical protein RLZZ592_164 [Pseudomonadota bacterium]|jgi:iron complex outermembrane receptor protein
MPKNRTAARQAVFMSALALLPVAAAAAAAVDEAALPRVEVTGSHLLRTVGEGSAPLRTVSRDEIERSGAASVADLLARLPRMQGMQTLSESVGNDGNGVTTASLHGLGARYTLVLLDGQRLAPADSGSVVDLGTLPLAALERIEILSDGASALYGADAIGGVVNLILRRGERPLQLSARALQPLQGGGQGWSASLSQGWGDERHDGGTLSWTLELARAQAIRASQREISSTGLIRFRDAQGRDLLFFNGSMRSVPANVAVGYTDAAGQAQTAWLNPGLLASGGCGSGHLEAGGLCYYDYASTVDVAPQTQSAGLTLDGSRRLEGGWTLRGTALWRDTLTRATVAPYPTDVALDTGSAAFARSVAPWLTQEQLGGLDGAVVSWRLQDAGPRVVDYRNRRTHLSAGLDGEAAGWQLRTRALLSLHEQRQDLREGWLLAAPFQAALADGRLDPFATRQDATGLAALSEAGWRGRYDTSRTHLIGLETGGSTVLGELPGGPAQLGLGAEWRRSGWSRTLSDTARSGALLSGEAQTAADLSRDSAGAYGELALPLVPRAQLDISLRLDRIGPVHDHQSGREIGQAARQATGRLGWRWQPSTGLMWRAAAGTGFRAPDLLQVAGAEQDYGVTSGSYACPFTAANGLGAHPYAGLCWPGSSQIDLLRSGNAELKPERSAHWSAGLRLEPSADAGFGADLWSVRIRDAVQQISERLIIADPVRYARFYAVKDSAATGAQVLALRLMPVNIGQVEQRGIDWQAHLRHATPWGRLTHRVEGTWLLRSRYTVPGTEGEWASSLGRFGVDDQVAFRHVIALSATLERGGWSHQARVNWRSGYQDMPHTEAECAVTSADGLECVGIERRVASHWTLDWSSRWQPQRDLTLTLAVLNLLDRAPPLSLRSTGAHMLGFDPRYASAQGRTLQIGMDWRF